MLFVIGAPSTDILLPTPVGMCSLVNVCPKSHNSSRRSALLTKINESVSFAKHVYALLKLTDPVPACPTKAIKPGPKRNSAR